MTGTFTPTAAQILALILATRPKNPNSEPK